VSSESENENDVQGIKGKGKLEIKEYELVDKEFPPNMIKAQGRTRSLWDAMIIILAVY
jgi:hypothetical protein